MKTAQSVTESQSDAMDPARGFALQVALGLPATVEIGAPLPPFFHQLHFWTPHPPENLGRDGHPRLGGLIPDMGLPRRMWAGGRLRFIRPLIAGQDAWRETRVEKAERKTGRSGPLGFVTLRHDIHQGDALCLSEWQELVYRSDPDPGVSAPSPPEARRDEDECQKVGFDSTLLFRYSALTCNGHRIHHDSEYARQVEGYAGLVVHGPLLAQLLMLMAEQALGPLTGFTFRATSPLILGETAELCRKAADLWVRGPDGRQCMVATAAAS